MALAKPPVRTAVERETAQRIQELHIEVTSLTTERDALRTEIVYMRNLLTYAFGVERWDIVLGVRDRLAGLGSTLTRRSAA